MTAAALITGGAGFIGSHLAAELVARGRRVVVVDDLSTGQLANLQPLLDRHPGRCTFVHARIGDALRDRRDLLAGVGQVFHLAASVGVMLVLDDPAAMIRNNIEETAAVLDAAQAAGVPALVASSSEVYGQCPVVPLREDMTLVYGPTTAGRWSYGLAKALDEHLALHRPGGGGGRNVVVRLFNTIGPRQVGRYGMVVPRMVERAASGEALEVYGDGGQTRCFCDVRDVVRALADLLDRAHEPGVGGGVFNVGSDREVTINELAELVLRLTDEAGGAGGAPAGAGPRIRHIPYDRAYGPHFEDPPRRKPELSRLRLAVGFSVQYPLERTLAELIAAARTGGQARGRGTPDTHADTASVTTTARTAPA